MMKKLMIAMFVLLMLTIGFASAETFTDDFNRADNSTLGNNWIEDETYGTISIIGNKAVINDTSSSQSINLQHCLVSDCSETNIVENVSFVWNVNNANQNNGFRISNIAGANSVLLLVSTGQLKYHDGSYHVLQSYTAGIDVQMTVFNMNYSTLTYSLDVGGTVYNNLGFQSANTGDQVIKFLTAATFTGHIYVDDVFLNATLLISNLPPVVAVSSPANNTETNQNLSVQFTTTDDNASTTECSIYKNGGLDTTNSSVVNNTLTTFTMVWDDGLNTFEVQCTDGEFNTSSGVYSLYFDEHEPNIVSGSPLITNSTVYTGFTMQNFGNVTNLNLTNVTRIILYPNSSEFYVNETTSFVNGTFLGWDETFNTTLEPNGVWSYSIYAEDLVQNHTHYYSFTVNNCVPDWVCDGYESCPINNSASCDSVVDNNACGLPFGTLGEAYTDFTPQACDYCDDSLDLLSYGTCNIPLGYRMDDYQDLNFGSCCNVTQINNTDCPFGNVSEFGQTNESCSSQYISGYIVSDLTEVTVDFLVLFLIAIVGLTGVIGLVIVFKWAKKQVKK